MEHVLLGSVIGAAVGVAITAVLVQDCNSGNTHHDGPPCELGYVIFGVPATAGGAALGAVIGYFSAHHGESQSSAVTGASLSLEP